MSRATLISFGATGLGLVGLGWLALGGAALLASYRAAWLLVLALPVGALPLVIGMAGLGLGDRPLARHLRALLILMPVAALMAIPVLLRWSSLYPTDVAQGWTSPTACVIRTFVVLVVWTVLALMYRRPAGETTALQRRFAGPGLVLHLVMATVAATDWVGAIDPGLNASGLGLLVMLAQMGLALAVACLMAARFGDALGPGPGVALALLAAAWMFLHFTQYLVVWSANLPEETGWYIRRGGGLGLAVAIAAVVVVLLAIAGGLTRVGTRGLVVLAALLAGIHALEWFWLAAPVDGASFALALPDAVALVAAILFLGGMSVASRSDPEPGRPPHGV